jgi:5'-3' exonuclease
LSAKELLFAKIIRDADKLDNFRVKANDDVYAIANIDIAELSSATITESIYNAFMNSQTIVSSERRTSMDIWVSYIAFIFDLYFPVSLSYILERDYINILVDRIKYHNIDTKLKMNNIREFANMYIYNAYRDR